ncbi:MAG: hypothetical protein AB7P04_15225 [Bacteriovoracia bacterium]
MTTLVFVSIFFSIVVLYGLAILSAGQGSKNRLDLAQRLALIDTAKEDASSFRRAS